MLSNRQKLLISFSGGETSAMMTKHLLDNYQDKYDMQVVFANTGHERLATLDFVKNCDEIFGFNTVWVEAVVNPEHKKGVSSKVVTYSTAYRNILKNGIDPFEAVIAKYGIPNIAQPHCTRELKSRTIKAYQKSIGLKTGRYITAIGIRSDEPKRINLQKASKERLLYYAQLQNITKSGVNAFWEKQPFRLPLKSYQGNCLLCWKKSLRKLLTTVTEGIILNDPELLAEIEWLKHIENKYGLVGRRGDLVRGLTMFRGNLSICDLVQSAKTFSDFYEDEPTLLDEISQLSSWTELQDDNAINTCSESCEAF